MRAARAFAEDLAARGLLDRIASVHVELLGSLGATGRGHGTDRAIVLGLGGERPDEVEVDAIPRLVDEVRAAGRLLLLGRREIPFRDGEHLRFERHPLPGHPNGMRFRALGAGGEVLASRTSYSVGGGFVVDEGAPPERPRAAAPLPFHSAGELLRTCEARGLSPAGVMLENEKAWRGEREVREGLLRIWRAWRRASSAAAAARGSSPAASAFLAAPPPSCGPSRRARPRRIPSRRWTG
jgi:L-serine dehydratase